LAKFERILIIVNPVSGLSQGQRVGRRLAERLERLGMICTLRSTGGREDATRWAQEAGPEGFDLIVAIGGDGTVQEVVAGLMRSPDRVPLAHLPVGTANVIAIALSLPWTIRQAAEVIRAGRVLPFDVGYLPKLDRHFLLMAAIGYPARIIRDSPRRWKNLFGIFTYVAAAIRNLFLPEDALLEIEAGPAPLVLRGHTVLITNIGRIQYIGLKVSPHTSPHDGLFDISIVSSKTVVDVLKILWRILTWRRQTPNLRELQAKEVRIVTNPPLPVQIDGEIIGTTPIVAEVVFGAVRVVVPRGYRETGRFWRIRSATATRD
jgi:YegS/Rv2252/BmrU family lipid kinase